MYLSKNIVWSPSDYTEAAVIAHEAGEELLARLEWMTLKPKVIVDIGCGLGVTTAQLQKRYPAANVLALDNSEPMLQSARNHLQTSFPPCGGGPGWGVVAAHTYHLPLKAKSVDLIFANFLIPWQPDIKSLFHEWRRILRPDGLLIFTALGPDTLRECVSVLAQADMPQLIDMHDFGDVLLQEGFADPVLDVNYYTTTYREKTRLIHDLRASGMWFPALDIDAEKTFAPIPVSAEGVWPVTYEVVYAHAFAPAERNELAASADGTVRVPLAHLRRQLGDPRRS